MEEGLLSTGGGAAGEENQQEHGVEGNTTTLHGNVHELKTHTRSQEN